MKTPRKPARKSAGVVIVRRSADAWKVLVLRAYRHWDFPKGVVERGETPLDAALREAREETTLDDLRFAWGVRYCETEPYAGGKVARYYVAESPGGAVALPVNPALGFPEHHEHRWLTFAEARERLVPRLQRVLDWARSAVEG
jgi:bis(5'-nucleosidyl)-tetraphosphatase